MHLKIQNCNINGSPVDYHLITVLEHIAYEQFGTPADYHTTTVLQHIEYEYCGTLVDYYMYLKIQNMIIFVLL